MSWIVGMLLNGIICFGVGSMLSLAKQIWLKVIAFVFVPYLMAYALYWGLAYIESAGSPSAEYSSWLGLIVGPWAAAGYLAMGAGLAIFTMIRAKRGVRS